MINETTKMCTHVIETNDRSAGADAEWTVSAVGWNKLKKRLPAGSKSLNVSGRQIWLAQGQKEGETYISELSQACTKVTAKACERYLPSAHALM